MQNGSFRTAAVSGGTIKVSKEGVVILATAVEWADEIDVGRAVKAKELAESRISQYTSQPDADDKQMAIAEYKLKRALNRIETSKFR